jgi:Ran GTPase-activating protein (RanGAP) involved in mRNA processing and transport
LEVNQHIESLELGSNNIKHDGARDLGISLENNKTLGILKLEHNEIGDVGVQELVRSLKKNKRLATLNLIDNQITQAGGKSLSEYLKTNPYLWGLFLGMNPKIGDEGIKVLATSLETNTRLVSLNLRENGLTDVSARVLANSLQKNTTLARLDLKDNKITVVGKKKLEAIKSRDLVVGQGEIKPVLSNTHEGPGTQRELLVFSKEEKLSEKNPNPEKTASFRFRT